MQDSCTDATTIRRFRQDLQGRLRDRIRDAIETTLEEKLTEALGSARHARTSTRSGYRHGTTTRTITTSDDTRTLAVPWGRVRGQAGRPTEFQSTVLPRYARRTREVDGGARGLLFRGRQQPAHSRGAQAALR